MQPLSTIIATLDACAAALSAAADDLRALQGEPPPVDPPADPEPEPEPEPDIGQIAVRELDPARLIYFLSMHSGGRYTRSVSNVILPRAAGVVVDLIVDSRVSGIAEAWHAPSYVVTCDGEPVGAFSPGTSTSAKCTLDLSGVADGWHLFDVVPSEGDETPVPYWMHVGAVQPQTWAPTQAGSFDLQRIGPGMRARWAKVPAAVSSPGYPLAPREWAPMTGHPAAASMFKRDLSPSINGDPPYLRTLDNGARTCLNTHAYAWSSFMESRPRVVLRDGPRGIGTVVGATHLQIGRRGGIYGLDCWRMFHVDPTGSVRTLLGWRHGPDGLELVGDWSAIPAERRGLHEAWGLAWDARTIEEATLDTSVLLDRGDGVMEHPHLYGPAGWIADTQNNRVLRVEFHPRDHSVPPVITEFLTGLNDPFDVVYRDRTVYVSERLSHRIAAYDADTGAFIETIVQGQPLSGLNKNRLITLSGTLDQRRAAGCGFEGLYILGDWLYYGSRAAQRVWRINLVTRVTEWVCDPYFDTSAGGSQFAKLAVRADGTVFVSSWESGAKGGPRAYRPDGTGWGVQSGASSILPHGRGGNYADTGYSTASAVDGHRIVYSGADYGLCELSLALPSDPPLWIKDLYAAGRGEYERAGYRLTHGVDGYGQWGYPLPWGQSAAMDYYLAYHGHTPA